MMIFKDLGVGKRIKVAELQNLIAKDPAYQNISTELEDELKQVILELRELKKVGVTFSLFYLLSLLSS